jgi:hypothetical protein
MKLNDEPPAYGFRLKEQKDTYFLKARRKNRAFFYCTSKLCHTLLFIELHLSNSIKNDFFGNQIVFYLHFLNLGQTYYTFLRPLTYITYLWR